MEVLTFTNAFFNYLFFKLFKARIEKRKIKHITALGLPMISSDEIQIFIHSKK